MVRSNGHQAEAPASHLNDAFGLLTGSPVVMPISRFVLSELQAEDGNRGVGADASTPFSFTIFWRWQVISREQQHLINEQIRAREVRLIGPDGSQLGIKPLREALQMARDANLDLVNVAPHAKPPVCRIMDYGKFRYEQSKKEKEARRNQKVVQIKEIRLSPSIEENDIQTKLRNVRKFLEKGDKVKLSIRFRGREITHQDIGRRILERIAADVKELSEVERQPKLEGRQMIMILTPKQ